MNLRTAVPALAPALLLLALTGTSAPAQTTSGDAARFDAAAFDAYVREAVREWDVPGLAVAVVKDDSVVFAGAYGVRELGRPDPVDTGTLFAAASTTKALTAAAVGMLVDEERLAWDDPVVRHLPSFRLHDEEVTRNVTIRDLLTHRAGLPNADFLWLDHATPTDDIVRRLALVEPAYGFRAGFVYQNIMYAVAGEVVEAVSGMPWSEFVRTRIFQPLEMHRSVPTLAEAGTMTNVASPHDYVGGELQVIENWSVDPVAPAGSVWSSVDDMTLWLRFLLRGCRTPAGEQLLSEETCAEIFEPQTILPEPSYPTARLTQPHWTTYGLGWFQQDYEGRKTDFHTGSIAGMVALAGLILDEGIGIYTLANRDHAELRHALMYRVFDLFDAEPPRDWSTELRAMYDELGRQAEQRIARQDSVMRARRVPDTRPTLPLERYVGSYSDPLYGTVRIELAGDSLRIENGYVGGTLEHWHYDTFRVRPHRPWMTYRQPATFFIGPSGEPERLKVGQPEFVRVQQADGR